jgi:hypothetical protein
MSVLKRQRELKKAEKAARKRAKKHGVHEEGFTEPRPTVRVGELLGADSADPDEPAEREGEDEATRTADEDSV